MSIDFNKYLDKQIEKRRGYKGYSTTPSIPPVIPNQGKVSEHTLAIGDEVEVRGVKGKITDVSYDWFGGGVEYEVTFDEPTIPPKDMYAKKEVKYIGNPKLELPYKKYVNDEKYCPICGEPWHVDGYHGNWRDCLKCKKRREDIVK